MTECDYCEEEFDENDLTLFHDTYWNPVDLCPDCLMSALDSLEGGG